MSGLGMVFKASVVFKVVLIVYASLMFLKIGLVLCQLHLELPEFYLFPYRTSTQY